MRRFVQEFYGGLLDTTAVSWLGMVLFTLLEFGVCCAFFQPKRLAKIDPHYLMSSAHDEYASLSNRVLKLHYSKDERPHVVFLGASNATRSLAAHDDETMSRMLRRFYKQPVVFNVFSTNNQRFEDWLQIIELLPETFHGVVVLEMHDGKDDNPAGKAGKERAPIDRRRLALPKTPSITKLWASEGIHFPNTGNFFIDHLDFFAARREMAFYPGRKVPVSMGWGGKKDPDKFQVQVDRYQKVQDQIDEGHTPHKATQRPPPFVGKNREAIFRVVKIAQRHHAKVLMVQAPRFPPRAEAFRVRIEKFDHDMRTFCERLECEVWDSTPDLDLVTDDFQDAIHLNTKSKRRLFTRLLLQKVSVMLGGEDTGVGTDLLDDDDDDAAAADAADDNMGAILQEGD